MFFKYRNYKNKYLALIPFSFYGYFKAFISVILAKIEGLYQLMYISSKVVILFFLECFHNAQDHCHLRQAHIQKTVAHALI